MKSLDYGKKDLRWTKAFPLGMGAGATGTQNHARIKGKAQDNQQHSQGKVRKPNMPVHLNTPLITLRGLDAPPPAGRIHNCMENWQRLVSDPWVLDVVKVDLDLWPVQLVPPNPSVLNRKDQVLVQTKVEMMLQPSVKCPQ